MEYRVVDVFAEAPLQGNPLTVVLGAENLTSAQMQAIASETNHSETTFVTGLAEDGAWPVRIFTPRTELPFAGHPTLGTAHVLRAQALNLKIGRIDVRQENGLWWMSQKEARIGPAYDAAMLESCLGVPASGDVTSTGTPVGIVRVADSDAVRTASLNAGKYRGPEVAGLYVFATDSDHDIHARFFAPFVGITEDPATGGAAGPLAGWLHSKGEMNRERIIHQGIEMGRPSRLHIGFNRTPQVGGKVQDVARGEFLPLAPASEA